MKLKPCPRAAKILADLDKDRDAAAKASGQTLVWDGAELALRELIVDVARRIDDLTADYEQAAQVLGITSAAVKQAAYRMRKRYRELFRLHVARTVVDDSEVDDEIGRLLEILGG